MKNNQKTSTHQHLTPQEQVERFCKIYANSINQLNIVLAETKFNMQEKIALAENAKQALIIKEQQLVFVN